MKEDLIYLRKKFDKIAHVEPDNNIEYWFARDLQEHLGYARWENFLVAIKRAMDSCKSAGIEVSNHFRGVTKMVTIGSGAERKIDDFMLTRYACYLIAQNGDPRKEEIAFAQSYFALKTRKQELIEDRMKLIARMEARDRLKEAEKQLSKNIYERGVDDAGFGRIRSKGDAALFGGMNTSKMKSQYGVKDNRPLADFLPTLTIAAKDLATEMTNHNVTEADMHGEEMITGEHIQNNESVRNMLGKRGIKPEKLPPAEDIKKLERRVKREEKKLVDTVGELPRNSGDKQDK
ncbi:DNA-damage-inducible protein D [Desulfitispora alkaliphila]|uniref:DNA damage-inducible protein D n=1 Tax=Desulfitispora alkaliphila TaxID=622674 RepID=UPI003D1AA411